MHVLAFGGVNFKQNCRKPKTKCQLPLLSTQAYLDFVTPTKIPYISRNPYTSSKKVKLTFTTDDSHFKLHYGPDKEPSL